MIVAETIINKDLYSHEVPDNNALTASTKRMVDLGAALKGLPNQHAQGGKGSTKSLSEAVKEAVERKQKDGSSGESAVEDLDKKMLERASDAFGDQ